ncbi:MAG: M81 family metallopeptidase [Xanthomonadales bacterium]|nr:M81 family metallopeptidase [Xanthomonadales bacterium]
MIEHKDGGRQRVFVAGLCHETSAFSPIPTTRNSFERFDYHRPRNGQPDRHSRALNGYGAFVRSAAKAGYEVYASTYTFAQPSARTSRAGYESLRDEILGDLELAGDVCMVLYFLHGAQMAEGLDDCEGDLLSRTRQIVGDDCFIGALLDLHANVSAEMVEQASALVACRNYPHTDFDDRAEHLFEVGRMVVENKAAPESHLLRVPMFGMFYTTEPLMTAANQAAAELQDQAGVLSVSLIHGFTWANTPDTGAGVIAITDGDRDIQEDLLALGQSFFRARQETLGMRRSIGQILDEIEAAPESDRPFVIADCCDNPGGGAGGDSTFILEAILDRGLSGFALGLLWDPLAVEFASDAGVGSRLELRIGGKTGPAAGLPLDVTAEVVAIHDDLSQVGIGYRAPMGRCAVLDISGNSVILNTVRGQVFSTSCFTDCGVDLNGQRALVVKSTQHFFDQFGPIARKVYYCETPGPLSLTPDARVLNRIRRPAWPLDEVDFPGTPG